MHPAEPYLCPTITQPRQPQYKGLSHCMPEPGTIPLDAPGGGQLEINGCNDKKAVESVAGCGDEEASEPHL
jgi:hypothetical protein